VRTIAILTDFGLQDNFVGVMKGVILNINPKVNLVDISHNIKSQGILEAAILLKGAYRYFPKKTIFLAIVDPGVGSKRHPIIIQSQNYFFVGPDNGILSLAATEDKIKRIILIENKKYFLKNVCDTFHGRDIFAPTAAYLSKGKNLNLFGRKLSSLKKLNIAKPKENRNQLCGEIIYIDKFGNLVTNIEKNLWQKFIKNRYFRIKIQNKTIDSLVKSYEAAGKGRPLAIFGSFGFLEISVNGGSAKRYFGANRGTAIYITR
jgi:hypothetical protein